MEKYDVLIIGGGAAGISAAKEAKGRVLLVDRGAKLGGVLLQCTHRGFGNNLTGPEYTSGLLEDFPARVTLATETTVLSITKEKTALLAGKNGSYRVAFEHLILATGCREIPAGALPIAGCRPEGIYTAGQMQALMNLHGILPEGPVVILGGGDLGLIMAKQLAEKEISVTIVEKQEACTAMARNQKVLQEYPIGVYTGDTVIKTHGEKTLSGCTTKNGAYIPCKTLLIAVGLTPERELVESLENPPWLHICGNCNRIHLMVESVVNEGKMAAQAACK